MFFKPPKPLKIDSVDVALKEHFRTRELISEFWSSCAAADAAREASLEAERVAKGLDHPEWV